LAVRFQQYIVGNSPTLSGESENAWFIRLRVQPPDRLAFWGECWPKRPKSPLLYVRARVSRPDNLGGRAICAGGPDGHAVCRRSGSNNWYQSQVGPVHSQTNLGSQCVRGRLLGIVTHCLVRVKMHGL
jgi:hypothetical protein